MKLDHVNHYFPMPSLHKKASFIELSLANILIQNL
jgi:hypothetical protein